MELMKVAVNNKKSYRLNDIEQFIRITSSLFNFAVAMLVLSLLLLAAIYLFSGHNPEPGANVYSTNSSTNKKTLETITKTTKALEGPIIFRQTNQLAVYYSCNGQPFSRSYTAESPIKILCEGDHFFSVYANATKPNTYLKTDKAVTIISHINGDRKKLNLLLLNEGIIDKHGEWRFGNNHLVLLGNIVNAHGSNYDLLWQIYKLEYAAKKAGGDLHFIHGLQEQYLLESSNRNHIPAFTEIASTPFAYTFDSDTVLGQWLRSKNTMMMINNHLLSYAQPSKELLSIGMSIERINESLFEYWQHQYITSKLDFILNDNGPTKHLASESDFVNHTVSDQMNQLGIESWISSQGRKPMRSKPEYSVTIINQHQNDSRTNYPDVIQLQQNNIRLNRSNYQTIK
jgi:hypothetical protein